MNPNSNPSKNFSIPVSETSKVEISIFVPQLRAQGLDLTPWASTYVLAKLLYKLNIPVPRLSGPATDVKIAENLMQGIPILELGAGIGLVGMVASILWGRMSVLTDLGPIVPGLKHNVELNSTLLAKHHGSSAVGALDWEQPANLILSNGTVLTNETHKASVIIAADTIYDDNHPGILADCILKWLAKSSDARVILIYPLRVAYLEQLRELWDLLETSGLIAIEEGKEMAEANEHNWDDERLCEWSIWRWKT